MKDRFHSETRWKHTAQCRCRMCYGTALGKLLEGLGAKTELGFWAVFLTMTLGSVPTAGSGEYWFNALIDHLSAELGTRIEYVRADQRGELFGRFHVHALIAACGLDTYPLRRIEDWLRVRVGWSRALPFREGAGRYLARYIGRNLQTADWQIKIGNDPSKSPVEVGKKVIAESADVPSEFFRQSLRNRKR